MLQKLPDMLHPDAAVRSLDQSAVLPVAIMCIIVAPDDVKVNVCSAHFTTRVAVVPCQWITQPIPEQLSAKTADLKNLLADFPVEEWCAPVSGPEQGFRNKAKMVVSGSVEKPLLGMLHRDGTPEDLCDCPLYPASFAPVFAALKPFIARAGLTPYNVARKRGELKYILLTESQSDGGMMLRFVLRSDTKLGAIA